MTNAMPGNIIIMDIFNHIPINAVHTSLLDTCTVDSIKPVIHMLLEFTN
jgi:hypothetical protein